MLASGIFARLKPAAYFRPLRHDPTSGRVVDLLEAVDDQIEPELERAHLAVRAFAEVLQGVFMEVRIRIGGDRLRELCLEVRDLLCRVGVTRLPKREAEDVSVEDVVGAVSGRRRRLAFAEDEVQDAVEDVVFVGAA